MRKTRSLLFTDINPPQKMRRCLVPFSDNEYDRIYKTQLKTGLLTRSELIRFAVELFCDKILAVKK